LGQFSVSFEPSPEAFKGADPQVTTEGMARSSLPENFGLLAGIASKASFLCSMLVASVSRHSLKRFTRDRFVNNHRVVKIEQDRS
jgi:hypothetical protein